MLHDCFYNRPLQRSRTGTERPHRTLSQMTDLQYETLRQIPCSHSGRVEALHIPQNRFRFRFTKISSTYDFGQWRAQVSIVVKVANQQATDSVLTVGNPESDSCQSR